MLIVAREGGGGPRLPLSYHILGGVDLLGELSRYFFGNNVFYLFIFSLRRQKTYSCSILSLQENYTDNCFWSNMDN